MASSVYVSSVDGEMFLARIRTATEDQRCRDELKLPRSGDGVHAAESGMNDMLAELAMAADAAKGRGYKSSKGAKC